LSIEQQNEELTYVAVLPNKTAHFKLVKFSVQMASFEDPKNDFTSKILYELIFEKLDITLLGNPDVRSRSIKMQFTRK
jgi:hypothetical protein